MKFEKILPYFLQGKKIRNVKWEEGSYIYLLDGEQIKDENNEDVGYVFTIDDLTNIDWEFVPTEIYKFKDIMDSMFNDHNMLYKNLDSDYYKWIRYNSEMKCLVDNSDDEVVLNGEEIYHDRWINVCITKDDYDWRTICDSDDLDDENDIDNLL